MEAAAPDVVSFDLARYGLTDTARTALARLVQRGGRVAWGAIDPVSPGDTATACARLAAAIASLGPPAADVAAASLVTPTCGTGRLSPGRERLVAATLDAAIRVTAGAIAAHGARKLAPRPADSPA